MSETQNLFDSLLQLAVENGASDIHLKSGKPAYLRITGHLEPVEMEPISAQQIIEFIEISLPHQFATKWHENRQVDYSYDLAHRGLGRFRVNAFFQRNAPSMVFRAVKSHPPGFEELNHEPTVFKRLCEANDGIVLICGATGSGKSSTLAAMLDHMNTEYDLHIVTLEDPIEFIFRDKKSVFSQREVGIDAITFQLGLKSAMRQDPDVILVGEMRDGETFETALNAAETGHLVFGTLHTSNAQQAIQRLFDFFPPEQQMGLRRTIAGSLKAIISQQLCPKLEGGGRVPIVEIFVVDSLARKIIIDGQFEKIGDVIEANKENGSKSFNADLLRLIKSGMISRQDGLQRSPNPKALEMNLKGIFLQGGGVVG
jgi:twitching motility protein PilT